jgi:predicted anti-sigma-YlaC factor YlaD
MDDTTRKHLGSGIPAHPTLSCDDARGAVSARLDREEMAWPATVVDRHVAGCAPCRAWVVSAEELHRQVRLAAAPRVPDLSGRVLAAIGPTRRRVSWLAPTPLSARDRGIRLGLAVIALVQIGVALPALLFGEEAGLPTHTARHLGSFAVALGVGFLVAAWRPSRVPGLFAVAVAVVACLVASTAIDVASGSAAAGSELAHTPELVGLAALWLLARAERPHPLILDTA